VTGPGEGKNATYYEGKARKVCRKEPVGSIGEKFLKRGLTERMQCTHDGAE
jgi:hypothetical protein